MHTQVFIWSFHSFGDIRELVQLSPCHPVFTLCDGAEQLHPPVYMMK